MMWLRISSGDLRRDDYKIYCLHIIFAHFWYNSHSAGIINVKVRIHRHEERHPRVAKL